MIVYKTAQFSIFFGDQATSFAPREFFGCTDEAEVRNSSQFAQISAQLGLHRLALIQQTHSIEGLIIQDRAHVDGKPYAVEGDYLITSLPQIGLAIATADCLPIVIYDPVHHVLAAIHAGWRGSVEGIAHEVIKQLQSNFASNPADLQIFFGPSAGVCCYEVDAPFVEALPQQENWVVERGGKIFFDNLLYNQVQLENAGVASFNREQWQCTICSPEFCSYRRDGKASRRQMTIAVLKSI